MHTSSELSNVARGRCYDIYTACSIMYLYRVMLDVSIA